MNILRLLSVVCALLVSGCVFMPYDPSEMTTEQLAEWNKNQKTMVSCRKVNAPWGNRIFAYVLADKSVGNVSTTNDCAVNISNPPPVNTPTR